MTIPDFQSIMLPLLKFAADRKLHRTNEATEEVSKYFNLSEEEKEAIIPSGQLKIENRVGWVRTHLKKAGLIDYPQRGYFQITQRGIDVLDEKPSEINMKYLMRFPEYAEFRTKTQTGSEIEKQIDNNDDLPPEESIENAYKKLREELADELLDYVIRCTPAFFERLVVELLVAMGYGGSQENAARAVGRSGDEGIDGIIDEDRLGLDSVYIQAKKYQKESKIGAHHIRDFIGALQGARANKGVFITTAEFTKEAMDFVTKISSRIVLINGQRLTNLMIDHGIGVTTRIKYEIKKIDTDYFGGL